MNKQINKVKLAITTKCNLNCDYCFVKKTNQDMDFATAKNAIDLLLESERKDKLLSVYGGEPLLNFKLIEKICPYAITRAEDLRKNLIISVCTNGTLLEKKHLDFFEKYDIRLIISLVGEKSDHDEFRSFKKQSGSYEKILEKLPMVFKKIPPEHLGVSFCLFPSTIERMEENFDHLMKLGFNYINFEIIHHYQDWTKEAQEKFHLGLNKIIKFVIDNIPKEDFIFLNPINWEIKYQKISQSLGLECPFWYKLEIYPLGEMAFSPFLLNAPNREKHLIGNVNQGLSQKFKECQYSPKDVRCKKCQFSYFPSENTDKGAERIYELYRTICLKAAKEIKNQALENKLYTRYIKKIKEEVCF
ncbi:radical SAM protein [Patescibacteria group bacterium]|nr:radical SAM protein [Patescibacteria group bacterium]